MGAFKNFVEPLALISLFTAGCLINRRRTTTIRYHNLDDTEGSDSGDGSPYLKPVRLSRDAEAHRPSNNIFFRLLSRFWNKYPFLREIWYWNLTYWIYQVARAVSARMISGNKPVFDRAQQHALNILSLEHFLGIDIEHSFQHYILEDQPWLMPILARVYYSHITVGVAFLVYTYTFVPAHTYQRIRRTIAMDNAFAFVIVTLYRCMPPRLLPEEYGFVDVLHSKAGGGNVWTHNKFQLTIAAMPSLHFGTSLFLAACIVQFSPHRILRTLAPLWPISMLITIVATANHFLLDAAVGAVIPFLGWRYNHVLLKLLPLHNAVFAPVARRMTIIDNNKDRAGSTFG